MFHRVMARVKRNTASLIAM